LLCTEDAAADSVLLIGVRPLITSGPDRSAVRRVIVARSEEVVVRLGVDMNRSIVLDPLAEGVVRRVTDGTTVELRELVRGTTVRDGVDMLRSLDREILLVLRVTRGTMERLELDDDRVDRLTVDREMLGLER
jgi:hypothetical protein